jgi:hypothetical protein
MITTRLAYCGHSYISRGILIQVSLATARQRLFRRSVFPGQRYTARFPRAGEIEK